MKRKLIIAFLLLSVINSPAIFAKNNDAAETKKTEKTSRKKKKEVDKDTIFIRGIADGKTVAIPLEGGDHVVVSVTNDSLNVQPGKKQKVSKPSSKYGGHVVTRNELEKSGETYLLKAIALKVPGVKYAQGDLLIRGGATTFSSTNTRGGSATAPLYLVDGVETSYVSHLLVAEVEYVEVLKDSSTSMFGIKGGNGVIVINRIK